MGDKLMEIQNGISELFETQMNTPKILCPKCLEPYRLVGAGPGFMIYMCQHCDYDLNIEITIHNKSLNILSVPTLPRSVRLVHESGVASASLFDGYIQIESWMDEAEKVSKQLLKMPVDFIINSWINDIEVILTHEILHIVISRLAGIGASVQFDKLFGKIPQNRVFVYAEGQK